MKLEKRLEVTDKSARIMATKIDKYVSKLNECKDRLKIAETKDNPIKEKSNKKNPEKEVKRKVVVEVFIDQKILL